MPMPETPLEGAQRVFVHGERDDAGVLSWPTLDRAAYLADADPADVRIAAAAGSWMRLREAAQRVLRAEARARHAAEVEAIANEIDQRAMAASVAGLTLIAVRTQEVLDAHSAYVATQAERRRKAEEAGIPLTASVLMSPVDARELRDLATAAQAYQGIGERGLGRVDVRTEVSGPDGGAVQLDHRLATDDEPDRLARLMSTLANSRLVHQLPVQLVEVDAGPDD